MRRFDWAPDISGSEGPLFEAIARCIADDIDDGRLSIGDHLPTQRALARRMGLDVTTVARGYAEAARIGLIEARVGAGTFVRGGRRNESQPSRRADLADRSMNQPPDVQEPGLLDQMRASVNDVGQSLPQLLRYQPSGGVSQDKSAATDWLTRRGILVDQHALLITAGAHAAISATLSVVMNRGDAMACEAITYPGLRKIANTLGVTLCGLPADEQGIDPQSLIDAARRKHIRVLYLNPTLRNPTTETIPVARRAELVDVARRFGITIIEDDAYGFLPVNPPPAFAMLAPELTYYIAGLAKCLGPGLRIAYLLTPTEGGIERIADSLRAVSVMASPLMSALASHWIESGLADAILASIRAESRARRRLLAKSIPSQWVSSSEYAFHAWIQTPEFLRRERVVDWTRGYALGAVASDEFCVGIEPPEAFRLCLGGAASREDTARALDALADLFQSAGV
ncbi:MAG: PLP-dependent aminotransferase family protein [Planctomycetota bacterium]